MDCQLIITLIFSPTQGEMQKNILGICRQLSALSECKVEKIQGISQRK